MQPAQKLKIALDETRTLVLGTQVLLGFQMRAPFEDRYAELPATFKIAMGTNLSVLFLCLGLLIVPAICHRVIWHGDYAEQLYDLIGRMMFAVLSLFALSLGLSILIFFAMANQIVVGVAVAGLVSVIAFAAWCGTRREGKAPSAPSEPREAAIPLADKVEQLLTEARVILPGVQALLGFQLVVVFTDAFAQLPGHAQVMHGAALAFIAGSVTLLIAPAAVHRRVYNGDASERYLVVGGRLIWWATLSLSVGLAADIYVTVFRMSGLVWAGATSAILTLAGLAGGWHIAPFLMKRHTSRAGRRS